jgi:hypothetical protein
VRKTSLNWKPILNSECPRTDEYEDENERLDLLATQLDDAWKSIVKKTQQNEKTTSLARRRELTPTKEHFNSIVKDCQTKLQRRDKDKWNKTKNWFRKTAATINNHNYLFALIPAGDKYTSIITGSFTALVKAGATYDDVVVKFEDYLDTIHDRIILLRKSMEEMPRNPFLRVQMMKFTVALFEFLFQVLTWLSSSWERFTKSLSDALQKHCDRLMARMRECEEHARAYCVDTRLQRLGLLLEAGLFSQAQQHFGRQASVHTGDAEAHATSEQMLLSDARELSDPDAEERNSIMTDHSASPAGWDKSSILESTAHLARYSQDDLLQHLHTRFKDLTVQVDVYSRIQSWISMPSARVLGIEGPAGAIPPSLNTLCAAYVASRVQQLGIPTVQYFCSLDYQRPLDLCEKLEEIVYSLIHQVALALPEQVDSTWHHDLDLSGSRFSCLDGKISSLDSSIDLLGDLLRIAPSLMFCIIDGLQLLDRDPSPASFESSLQHFLDTLSAREVGTSTPAVLKVLFTTDGICLPLKKQERLGHIEVVLSAKGRGTESLRVHESDLPGSLQ